VAAAAGGGAGRGGARAVGGGGAGGGAAAQGVGFPLRGGAAQARCGPSGFPPPTSPGEAAPARCPPAPPRAPRRWRRHVGPRAAGAAAGGRAGGPRGRGRGAGRGGAELHDHRPEPGGDDGGGVHAAAAHPLLAHGGGGGRRRARRAPQLGLPGGGGPGRGGGGGGGRLRGGGGGGRGGGGGGGRGRGARVPGAVPARAGRRRLRGRRALPGPRRLPGAAHDAAERGGRPAARRARRPAAPAPAPAEKTPGADGPGPGAPRPKVPDGGGKENAEGAPEARAKSAVRVRLEDRFNSIPAEPPPAPRGAEPPEPGVALNNLVTLIRHPSEFMNVPLHQQQNKCTTLVKNKTAAAATALQFTCPLFTANACSAAGGSSLSQTQGSGNPCSILEAAKHQDIGLPRAFSFCYQQEIESTKQTLGSRNKALPEQVWIKVGEEALCKQAINKRNRSRIRQLDTNVERRALGEIQNVGEGSTATQGAWPPAESSQANLGEQTQSGPQGGRSQRRERHNRMERDRRWIGVPRITPRLEDSLRRLTALNYYRERTQQT
uniref:Transcription factor like 5 n=1 Tax=Canis lupus familiaris TaxID=9615 RepID=A0A8P0TUX4_CANLF